MLASLRLAVELPPVPAGTLSLDPWWQAARLAADAGAGIVWFTGGPAVDDPVGRAAACDPCTMAAAAVAVVPEALLGVVSAVPADRHPSVVARDVTTLDVVSSGRAALMLRWAGNGAHGMAEMPGVPRDDIPAACDYLGEAVAVSRAVLRDDDPVFEGRHLHVAGAVNRPPPSRPSWPALFVEVPTGAAGFVRREPGPAFLLRQAVTATAAIVCPDDPGEIASWRAFVEDAAASVWTGGDPRALPAVVCRTTLRYASGEEGDSDTPSADRASTGLRMDAARAAGADGVLVRLPAGRRGDGLLRVDAGDVGGLLEELAGCFGQWRADG